jgi:hypothetical protein
MVSRRKPRGKEAAVEGLDIGALVEDLRLNDVLRAALLPGEAGPERK